MIANGISMKVKNKMPPITNKNIPKMNKPKPISHIRNYNPVFIKEFLAKKYL
jgi:hypothetical protein